MRATVKVCKGRRDWWSGETVRRCWRAGGGVMVVVVVGVRQSAPSSLHPLRTTTPACLPFLGGGGGDARALMMMVMMPNNTPSRSACLSVRLSVLIFFFLSFLFCFVWLLIGQSFRSFVFIRPICLSVCCVSVGSSLSVSLILCLYTDLFLRLSFLPVFLSSVLSVLRHARRHLHSRTSRHAHGRLPACTPVSHLIKTPLIINSPGGI